MGIWKKFSPGIGGFGIGLLMWVLEVAGVNIPPPLVITLGILAVLMIVFSAIMLLAILVDKVRTKKKPSQFEITLYEVRLDATSNIKTQVLISLTFKTPTAINLGKLDLVFEGISYSPVEMPTKMISGAESHRVEYIIPRFRPDISMSYLLQEEAGEEANPAHLSILAGNIAGDTKPFPIITTSKWLASHRGGYQIL